MKVQTPSTKTPPILVISLKRSSGRRKTISQQLKKLNLKFKFFDAVDGTALTAEELKLYSKRDSLKCIGRSLAKGEIGCFLSHIKVWEYMIKKNWDKVIVLEDDVLVGLVFKKFLSYISKLPEDWEMINFYTNVRLFPCGDFIFDIYRPSRTKITTYGCLAYLLNMKGAKKLLRNSYPIRCPVDTLTGDTKIANIVLYCIHPQIASVNPDIPSTIWSGQDKKDIIYYRFNYNNLKNKIYFFLKKIEKKLMKLDL